MQTNILPQFLKTDAGREADTILRSCVHCGFCTATCPTYLELGDERDGPRGRIYLIKQLLEKGEVSEKTRTHLDRCLTCRSCETTCPSGVQYGRLVDIGRGIIEQQQNRPLLERILRKLIRIVLPYPGRFAALLKVGQICRPILLGQLKAKVPISYNPRPWATSSHPRKMLALGGCVQSVATPDTNAVISRVLDKLGITLLQESNVSCCGAVSYHLSAHEEGLDFMRRNIDAWWPAVEDGVEAIISSASGCGTMVKEYGHLLASDPVYAEKAKTISGMTKDISEVLLNEELSSLQLARDDKPTAFHCPCTLQHAQKLPETVQTILRKANINLVATREDHLCCGSAGTYSILQPAMSAKLLKNKLRALMANKPERIVTANIGCQLHIASKSSVPVAHWIELLDP